MILFKNGLKEEDRKLYEAALDVEQDKALHEDMAAWDETIEDGLDNEK